jgi:hypothetical protein
MVELQHANVEGASAGEVLESAARSLCPYGRHALAALAALGHLAAGPPRAGPQRRGARRYAARRRTPRCPGVRTGPASAAPGSGPAGTPRSHRGAPKRQCCMACWAPRLGQGQLMRRPHLASKTEQIMAYFIVKTWGILPHARAGPQGSTQDAPGHKGRPRLGTHTCPPECACTPAGPRCAGAQGSRGRVDPTRWSWPTSCVAWRYKVRHAGNRVVLRAAPTVLHMLDSVPSACCADACAGCRAWCQGGRRRSHEGRACAVVAPWKGA